MVRTVNMSQFKSKMRQIQNKAERELRQIQRDTERKMKSQITKTVVNVNIKMYKKGNISMYKKRNMICTTYESFFMDEEASSVISLVL